MSFLSRIKNSDIAKSCYVGKFTTVIECKVGKYSYIGSGCKFFNSSIGKFCSIGSGIKVIFGNHPTQNYVSTSPYFYSLNVPLGKSFVRKTKYDEFKFLDLEKKYRVYIGNDVWIGNDSLIMEGIKIGDGAIIAAGSVVVKNVEPYEIVGGNPAHHIRYRFSSEEIQWLLDLEWWNKSDEWIHRYAESFEDICVLKEKLRNE